jgi:hypothetical protein
MQLVYQCARCQGTSRSLVAADTQTVTCTGCGAARDLRSELNESGAPTACVLCGCQDLWRQKDFPPQLGLTIVGLGALASSIAWSFYMPGTAIAILMAFALFDLVLYAVMKDVLVCYRCGARHRHTHPSENYPRFQLDVAERYRQEAKRLEESQRHSS